MPAESSRLQRRLRTRDRRFLSLVVTIAAVCTPLAVVLGSHDARPPSGCVSTLRQGFMGGQTTTYCGARARQVCLRAAPDDGQLAALCRRQALAVRADP